MICLFFIPESPRWLAMYGRERELEVTLKRLRGENGDILEEAAEIRVLLFVPKILLLLWLTYTYFG
jgi:hypothetical protein